MAVRGFGAVRAMAGAASDAIIDVQVNVSLHAQSATRATDLVKVLAGKVSGTS